MATWEQSIRNSKSLNIGSKRVTIHEWPAYHSASPPDSDVLGSAAAPGQPEFLQRIVAEFSVKGSGALTPANPCQTRPRMKPPRPAPDPVRDKFALARRELSAALIERDDEVDLVLTALIANEHALLVGPPGCGKSLLLDSVLARTGGAKFSILLTKFTTPEEVVGPVSLAALKEDRYVRVDRGQAARGRLRVP